MNQIRNKIKNLFKRKPKKKVLNNKINCQVVEINEEADCLADALGISDERNVYLIKFVLDEFSKHTDMGKLLVKCSQECVHPNELALVSYLAAIRQIESTNPFLRIQFLKPEL